MLVAFVDLSNSTPRRPRPFEPLRWAGPCISYFGGREKGKEGSRSRGAIVDCDCCTPAPQPRDFTTCPRPNNSLSNQCQSLPPPPFIYANERRRTLRCVGVSHLVSRHLLYHICGYQNKRTGNIRTQAVTLDEHQAQQGTEINGTVGRTHTPETSSINIAKHGNPSALPNSLSPPFRPPISFFRYLHWTQPPYRIASYRRAGGPGTNQPPGAKLHFVVTAVPPHYANGPESSSDHHHHHHHEKEHRGGRVVVVVLGGGGGP